MRLRGLEVGEFASMGFSFALHKAFNKKVTNRPPSIPLPLPQPIVVRMMMIEGFSVWDLAFHPSFMPESYAISSFTAFS